MEKCPNCGYWNAPSKVNCIKCNDSLSTSTITPNTTTPNNSLSSSTTTPKIPKPNVLNPDKKLGSKLYLIIGLIAFSIGLFVISVESSILMIVVSVIVIVIILKKHENENKKRRLLFAFQHFQISDIDNMSGVEFENTLKAIFEELDYRVSTTRVTGDYGVDLILEQSGKKIGVQAKKYTSKVSLDAVQQISSGIMHYNLPEAWVVTNNYFTKSAMNLAHSTNVILIDRDGLTQCVQDAYQNMLKKNY